MFHFPTAQSEDIQVKYKQYADMDIVEVEEIVAVDPSGLPGGNTWIVAVAIGLFLALLTAIFATYRRRNAAVVAIPRFTMPAVITPLSALALLRRIEEDSTALAGDQHATLQEEVQDLERRYFAPGEVEEADPVRLRQQLQGWLDRLAS